MTTRVHFLHIGKTGGTAIKVALSSVAKHHDLLLHHHTTVLRDVPQTERVFFVVRDPIKRFVSSFNSRLRMGRPRNDKKWTESEAVAFARFRTPNELAEALSSSDSERKAHAQDAMRGIIHVNEMLSKWLEDESYIESRRASIIHIGLQETLAADFEQLKRVLGIRSDVRLPTDPVKAHVTPQGFDATLSELGKSNIATWYANDIKLYEFLKSVRSRLHAGP